jgi:hypothetical protein
MGADRLSEAHRHCKMHKEEIALSESCGCFHCLSVFSPGRVEAWCDGGETALCPFCGVDAVIGDASGFAATEAQFLLTMKSRWFETGSILEIST